MMTFDDIERYIIKPIREGDKTTYGKKELVEFIYQRMIRFVMDKMSMDESRALKEVYKKGGK